MWIKQAFLSVQNKYSESEVVILPIAYDSTVSYGVGARYGPHTTISASTQLEWYDKEFGTLVEQLKIHTMDELWPSKEPKKAIEEISKLAEKIIKDKKKIFVLGGEHSITSPIIKSFKEDVSIVHFDAHLDLRKEYEETAYSHASALYGLKNKIVHIGIRSICEEDLENSKEHLIYYADEKVDVKQMLDYLGDKVYVTFDIDVLDPSLAPETGTPEPGGLKWWETLKLLKAIGENKEIVGADLVEIATSNLQSRTAFTAAKLAYKMCGYFWLTKNHNHTQI